MSLSDVAVDQSVLRLRFFLLSVGIFLLGILAGRSLSIWKDDRAGCRYGTVKTMVTEQDGEVHIVCAAPPVRPDCASLPVHAWDLKVIPYDREARDAAVEELAGCWKESKRLMWALSACEVGRTLDASQCTLANAPAKAP